MKPSTCKHLLSELKNVLVKKKKTSESQEAHKDAPEHAPGEEGQENPNGSVAGEDGAKKRKTRWDDDHEKNMQIVLSKINDDDEPQEAPDTGEASNSQ